MRGSDRVPFSPWRKLGNWFSVKVEDLPVSMPTQNRLFSAILKNRLFHSSANFSGHKALAVKTLLRVTKAVCRRPQNNYSRAIDSYFL